MFTCRSVLMIMILYGELCNLQEDVGVRRISALELRLIFQTFSKSQEFSEIEPLVAGMQVVEIEPIQWHSMSL